jgi:parallel beta-helix repeat protein
MKTFLLFLLLSLNLSATEYFVAKNGNNANPGTSKVKAFLTIKKGVATLQSGDVLTIGPGEYFESIWCKEPGVTIKAEIPGTVLFRGDVDAPAFKKTPGLDFVWEAKLVKAPQAVNERDSLTIYTSMSTPVETDDKASTYHYDQKKQKLYVHTSDSKAPDKHFLTLSMIRDFGLMFRKASDITVDGLAFTGYNCSSHGGFPGNGTKWGLYTSSRASRNVQFRNCTAFLNGGGIAINKAQNCLIENCTAYANYSPFSSSGGNIIIWTPAKDSIERGNLTFRSARNGLRFYGSNAVNCRQEYNIAYDNKYGDIWIKGRNNLNSSGKGNVSFGMHSVDNSVNCIFKSPGGFKNTSKDRNIYINRKLDMNKEFVDPYNLDFRIQSDSKFRGKNQAPYPYKNEVLFLSSKGSDSNDGSSVKKAFKTLKKALAALKKNDTLYILPGKYNDDLANFASGVTIRKRGLGKVFLKSLKITGVKQTVEGIIFTQPSSLTKSRETKLKNCVFVKDFAAKALTNANISHCSFIAKFLVTGAVGANLNSNIFNASSQIENSKNTYAAYNAFAEKIAFGNYSIIAKPVFEKTYYIKNAAKFNGRGALAMPIGPFQRIREKQQVKFAGVNLSGVGKNSASLNWNVTRNDCGTTLKYGNTPKLTQKVKYIFGSGTKLNSSMINLKPRRKYYSVVQITPPVDELFTVGAPNPGAKIQSKILEFTTLSKNPAPKTYYVSKQGSDNNNGTSRKQAFLTIRKAASIASGTDTVIVGRGRYSEFIPVLNSGNDDGWLTFKSAPGEKVWLDGNQQKRAIAFLINGKKHILIDGFYFANFWNQNNRQCPVTVYGGQSNRVTRCFYDGRVVVGYTPPFIGGTWTKDFTLDNSFVTRAFHGIIFYRCDTITIKNNVFYMNQINAMSFGATTGRILVSHNIIVDNTLMKYRNPVIYTSNLDKLIDEKNCYFMRTDMKNRKLVSYAIYKGKLNRNTLTLAELRKLIGQGKSSFFANPQMPAIAKLIPGNKDWKKYIVKHRIEEYKFNPKTKKYNPLDFADFVPRNPKCKGIGFKSH